MDLIKEPMYIERKACWLNLLDAGLEKYNNCVHGTTKMTSCEMSTITNKPKPHPIPVDNKIAPNPSGRFL